MAYNKNSEPEIDDMREYISELFEGNTEAQKRIPSDTVLELARKLHCANATDYEFAQFMYYCVKYNLDPLLGYVEFVKYDKTGNKPAQIFIGKRGMLTIASRNPNFVAAIPDIHYKNPNTIVAMNMSTESGQPITYSTMDLGTDRKPEMYGSCIVYRKDRDVPIYVEIKSREYNTGNTVWSSKQETMSKKVALTQALEMAFPEDYANGYSPEEFGLKSDIMRKTPEYITETVKSVYSSLPSIALPNGVFKPQRIFTDDAESKSISTKVKISDSFVDKYKNAEDIKSPVKSTTIESENDFDDDVNRYDYDDGDLSNDNDSEEIEDVNNNVSIIDSVEEKHANILDNLKNKNIVPSVKSTSTTITQPTSEEFSLF